MKIGLLALQGAFMLHVPHLEALRAEVGFVRSSEDLEGLDALILPGGESSTMLKLIKAVGLFDSLTSFIFKKPVWGICAGAILLAKEVSSPSQFSFGRLDISIIRNGYGSQLQSLQTTLENGCVIHYIRAPLIDRLGEGLEVLSQREGHPTWIQTKVSPSTEQSPFAMATTFHPEFEKKSPSFCHQHFFDQIKKTVS